MSLLSESVSQVAQSQNLVSSGLTFVAPPVTTHFSLLGGSYKQVVGFVMPRGEEYSYVLDLFTGQPLELPEGYMPTVTCVSAIQEVPDESNLNVLLVNSVTDPANADSLIAGNWYGIEINARAYYYNSENTVARVTGLAFQGYNWIVLKNLDYPTPILSGIIKVVIQYQTAP